MPIYKFEDFTSQIVEAEDISGSQEKRNLSNVFCPSNIDVTSEILSIDFLKYIQTGTPKNGADFLKICFEYLDNVLEINTMPEMLNIVFYLGANMERFAGMMINFHHDLKEGRPIEEIDEELKRIISKNRKIRETNGKSEEKESSADVIESLLDQLKDKGHNIESHQIKIDGDDPMSKMLMMMLMSKMMGNNKKKEEEDGNNEE
jgi:hypothetical protein